MSIRTTDYLSHATSRAKSDVANKLISMFLHAFSRRMNMTLGTQVTDKNYVGAVATAFGDNCCYCRRPLEADRVVVEHLDGMNRFRCGLHIPGNVILACRRCNGEKRRDDQLPQLILAEWGWESFLMHDSAKCDDRCKTCKYWRDLFPVSTQRAEALDTARNRIIDFRKAYEKALIWNDRARPGLVRAADSIYRECQEFATRRIGQAVDEVFEATKA